MPFIFDNLTITAVQLSIAIKQRQLTCKELTQACFAQIEKHDQQGLKLNAMLELSTTAVEEAEKLDEELKTGGYREPLHGIPMVVKGSYFVYVL